LKTDGERFARSPREDVAKCAKQTTEKALIFAGAGPLREGTQKTNDEEEGGRKEKTTRVGRISRCSQTAIKELAGAKKGVLTGRTRKKKAKTGMLTRPK